MTEGWTAPGFEEVRREFERNFQSRRELGAACAAYAGGEKVVDLWGGVRDARDGSPWERDTMVLVYSTSKGLSAMTLALAHRAGGWTTTSAWPPTGPSSPPTARPR